MDLQTSGFPIGRKDKWGKRIAAGEIHVEFDFVGKPGVAYPQRRPEIDSFDDSNRRDREAEAKKEKDEADKAHDEFHAGLGSDTKAGDTAGKEKAGPAEEEEQEEKPTRPGFIYGIH